MRKIFDFQVLGVSELRLKTDISTATHIQLSGVNIEHMSTKSANGGALLYIRDTINYKLRPNLNVENGKKLESISPKNIQKCYNWLHLQASVMHLKEFNTGFLKYLTEKLIKENNKEIILLGDFSIRFVKSNSNANASEFLNVIYY